MPASHFRIAIHGRPQSASIGPAVVIEGRTTSSLVADEPLAQSPLPVTFEEAQAALEQLPRLYFEPDGSFGWFAAPSEPRWELGGMLYDRGDRVMYAEITGACPAAEFRQVLHALGHGREPLAVQLIEQAIFLDAEEFCRWLN